MKVQSLKQPDAYPTPATDVIARETHMSWVFLVGDRVYKLKKPVRFSYLDFSTLERRAAACRAEYVLNKRLAANVYLGVAPLTTTPAGHVVDGNGPVVDWLVVMRRLDENETLETALRTRSVTSAQVDRLASILDSFYRRASRILRAPEAHRVSLRRMQSENLDVLLNRRFGLPQGSIDRIAGVQSRFLSEQPGTLNARVHGRHILDAHGDLRPEHIWLSDTFPIIDCLEFDARLRAIDALDEIAFLHLECERLGGRWVGEQIRRRLAHLLDDNAENGLFLFYRIQRAMLRARLSIAHLKDARPRTPEKWPRLARSYLRLAAIDAAKLEARLNSARRQNTRRSASDSFR